MTRVAVTGKYPRFPAWPGLQTPRELKKKLASGELTLKEYKAALDKIIFAMMDELKALGVTECTDGLIRFEDPWFGFAGRVSGFTRGRLIQDPGTNNLYRIPFARKRLRAEGALILDDCARIIRDTPPTSGLTFVPYVPGPFSLALYGESSAHKSLADFVSDCAIIVFHELKDLLTSKQPRVSHVYLAEPAVVARPELWPLAFETLNNLGAKLQKLSSEPSQPVRIVLLTWGGGTSRLSDFFKLPFCGFGLDFVAGRDNFEAIKEMPENKLLYAGLVDATTSKVETAEQLSGAFERLQNARGKFGRLTLAPNRHFTVSRSIAQKKLAALAALGGIQ